MYARKGMVIILCLVLIILFVACIEENKRELQRTPTSTISEFPAPTNFELPATPQPMESPFIPDEENVSLPDPG